MPRLLGLAGPTCQAGLEVSAAVSPVDRLGTGGKCLQYKTLSLYKLKALYKKSEKDNLKEKKTEK